MTVWPNGKKIKPRVTSDFGPRDTTNLPPGASRFHKGTDFVGFTIVRAVAAGRVLAVGWLPDWEAGGYQVQIQHSDYRTRSLHLKGGSILVKKGDSVIEGQALGTMGSSSSLVGVLKHLHFEVAYNGVQVDPEKFIQNRIREEAAAGGGGNPLPPWPEPNPTPTPTTRKRKRMSTGVIYEDVTDSTKRRGAVINTESGFISRFQWFTPEYADALAVGMGLEKAGPVTPGQYNAIVADIAALAKRLGNLAVDLNDADVAVIGGDGDVA